MMYSGNRRRPPLACEQCRRRKIRCDRKSPCSNCMRFQRSSCTYVPINHNTAVIRYDQAINLNSVPESMRSSHNGVLDPRPRHVQSASVQSLTDRVQHLEQMLEEVLGVPECSITPQDPAVHGRFLKTRFFGYSHRSNICESKFHDLLLLFYRFNAEEESEINILHEKCKQLSRAIKAQVIVSQPSNPSLRDLVPPRPVAQRLVGAYLRTFESVYRVVHRPSFLRRFEQFWGCRSAGPDFIVKLLLMMSIGSVFEETHISKATIAQWISVAQNWLTSPFERCRLDLDAIQVHCLLLIACQAKAIDSDTVWISTGSLLRTTMHMGLHLDPFHIVRPSPFYAELRRRLWATVLELIVQTSMDAGGLPLLHPDDYDCGPPRNLDDDQIDKDLLPAIDPETFTETSLQIALLRSLPVRLRIARAVNNFRSGPTYEDTLRFSTELSEKYLEAASLLRPSNKAPGSGPTPFQRKLYDLMTQRFLLALHDPFFTKAKSNPSYSFSRQLTLKTSLRILSLSSSTDEPSDYASLYLSGAAGFRDLPMQAVGVVCDELLAQISEDISLPPLPSPVKKYDDLRRPIEAYLSSALARLRSGETNIKIYLIFQCILAQADALQAGRNVNDAIKETLRDGLATCTTILETVAGDFSYLTNKSGTRDDAGNEFLDDWLLNDDFTGDVDSWLQDHS